MLVISLTQFLICIIILFSAFETSLLCFFYLGKVNASVFSEMTLLSGSMIMLL